MRVLLIEDDSAMARSIELMLRSEGLNVYTTDLGEEGIDLGKLYDYDIILLDEAQARFIAEDLWWREHRDAKELFETEFKTCSVKSRRRPAVAGATAACGEN